MSGLMVAAFLLAAGPQPALSGEQRARIESLESSLLAPCCYSEPVSRHRSDVAVQMKAEIAELVAEGKTDREILDLYKQRYGARVLMEPEGARWWWTNIVPAVVLALGFAFVVFVMKRWLRPLPSS